MGIADQLKQGPPRKYTICALGAILSNMEEQDKEAVAGASEKIRDGVPGYSVQWLHRTLVQEGFKLGSETVRRHVQGSCCCEPK